MKIGFLPWILKAQITKLQSHHSDKLIECALFSFLFICFIAFNIEAQTGVGKLAGKVTDSETGEPLIGANIVLINTPHGSTTNIDGEYFILNINPGTYEVQASYVGYGKKTITEIRMVAGITYELNINLTSGVRLDEIVVTDRKFFEEKATNTVKVVDAEDINRLPVKGVENIVSLQAGVVKTEGSGGASGNASINVRGGRGSEVLYIIDGIPQNDIYTGSNYAQVSNSAIEQISFQIGGYEAKYGQAQSGIVNVTTKSGTPVYSIYADMLTSSFTDDYGYNLYTATIGGPFIPHNSNHTFFISGERGWFLDGDPRAIGVVLQTKGYSSNVLPDNGSGIWRYTVKTMHNFDPFTLRLSANINDRDFRTYIHSYVKNNSEHNQLTKQNNYSFSSRISQNISNNAFWNLNIGYKIFNEKTGDGVWFDNLEAYGDSLANAGLGITLPNGNGSRVNFDKYGIFGEHGRVLNGYNRTDNSTLSSDFDLTTQLEKHLLEIGGGLSYNILRFYAIAPVTLASDPIRNLPVEEKYKRLQPTAIGFDITGKNKTSGGDFAPRKPLLGYAYVQDRYELQDMVLNLGIRLDYFDTQADIIKDPTLPFATGTDPNGYDPGDFEKKKPEFYISPRIGLGFPVTPTTVFHAQYGKFIQQPELDQLYTTIYDLNFLITDNNWALNTGHISSEVTTQYEIGFRQIIADRAALNITAFYKNTQGLINSSTVFFQRTPGGQLLSYITPTNTDFGTIKGLALSLDVSRVSYFSLSFDYTYQIAEGTGSSTTSSFTAAFRNLNGEIPKVIAPLDFDQRHTGLINLDFFVPKGDLGIFEQIDANILIRFNSGRPYTPLESENLLAGSTNFGDTKGYVNSAYGPGNFSVDFKIEKSFDLWKSTVTPYLWVENLFDADNPITVYQSTGDPYSTGWLNTLEGQRVAASQNDPAGYIADYKAYERNPYNFGIPRLIKLGLKINFNDIQF